ncbi:MAG: hypothetical protein IPK32_26195 [Verrucomicrobiaceae bacterium]|nr:hypothetical protein [Verrucomicrobiaceae bacterium]
MRPSFIVSTAPDTAAQFDSERAAAPCSGTPAPSLRHLLPVRPPPSYRPTGSRPLQAPPTLASSIDRLAKPSPLR